MSTQTTASHTTEKSPVFQLKGGLYTLTALQLLSSSLEFLSAQLDHKIKQAPKFFNNAPIVIDLQKMNGSQQKIDFTFLKEILFSHQLIPVGVKGGNIEQHAAAEAAGFAILQDSNKKQESEKENTIKARVPDNNVSTPTKLITQPVRSGQQIYAQGGDLIVLAPVSHGAELLADGHIHVYGPLRGRALAGITGDTHAHIFCHSLEAELISIAGQYQISEDIEPAFLQKAVNIYLVDGRLHIRQF